MSESTAAPTTGMTFVFPADPNPLAFIRLNEDNTVTVIAKHMEMGQGIYTGLATLVADELDAAREQIRVIAAPIGAAYGNPLMGGGQGTGGHAVWESVAHFRQAFTHPDFRNALAAYPSSAVASPHLFMRFAMANLCTA